MCLWFDARASALLPSLASARSSWASCGREPWKASFGALTGRGAQPRLAVAARAAAPGVHLLEWAKCDDGAPSDRARLPSGALSLGCGWRVQRLSSWLLSQRQDADLCGYLFGSSPRVSFWEFASGGRSGDLSGSVRMSGRAAPKQVPRARIRMSGWVCELGGRPNSKRQWPDLS